MAAAVVRELVGDRADERVLVGDLGVQRQVLADVDAGDVGLDGPKGAAVLDRGVRLHVERLHVWRPAGQPDEDDRRVRARRGVLGRQPEGEQPVGADGTERQGADLKEPAAGKRAGTGP